MQTITEIVGLILTLSISFLVLAYVAVLTRDLMNKHNNAVFKMGFDAGVVQTKLRLRQDACWFSEDPSTYKLLRDIMDVDVSTIRNEWRDSRRVDTHVK